VKGVVAGRRTDSHGGTLLLASSVSSAMPSPDLTSFRNAPWSSPSFSRGAALGLMVLWLASRSWQLTIDVVSFGVLGAALTLLVGTFFAAELRAILFRADTLIWSESPFLNDVIKFRSGGTLYDTPADLSSFNYTPGAPLVTWGLVSLAGLSESVAAYRVVQVLFVVIAAALGVRAAALLRTLHGGVRLELPWMVAWFSVSGRYQHAHESIQPPAT
jgi:hypothetical protein